MVHTGYVRSCVAGASCRHNQSFLEGEQLVAWPIPAEPSRWSGRPDERFDFGARELIDRPFLVLLGGHLQHLLAVMQELRFIDISRFVYGD